MENSIYHKIPVSF